MPDNSRNPGFIEFVCLTATITSLTAFSIDALLPALLEMGQALSVNDKRDTQFLITIFIVGMAVGELVFGPLSDAIGRKSTILIGLFIYCAGSLLTFVAQSFELALLGRLLQGFGVSGPKIGTRALIRDRYSGEAMAKIMSLIFTLFILVPMLAPAIGQFTMELVSWRAIFALYVFFAVLCGLWIWMRQPETLLPTNRIQLNLPVLIHNGLLVLQHRRVMACTLASGGLFGSQLLFLSVAQSVFLDIYGIQDQFPLYFALLALVLGLSAFANSRLVERYGMFNIALRALQFKVAFSVLSIALAIIYSGKPPLALFLLSCALVFGCVGLLIGNLGAMAMQSLGTLAGLGASLIASVSSLVAFVLAAVIGRFYNEGVGVIASAYLIASTASLLLIRYANTRSIAPVQAQGLQKQVVEP